MNAALDQLTRALADRYRIEREIGAGGMATVYLAQDLKHHRPVAIKVLRPSLAEVLGPERFLREIQLAAQLTHPHILPLHDSGEASGALYYVMPFIEGESLRQRLVREGPLPIAEAIGIAANVADALGHAHQKGIVHRDVKPENILLAGGHALVMDFGIARPAAGTTRLTETGLVVGTPQYMSPEQTLGDAEVDGRSDVYSLGCLLYEMLTGSPPFAGATLPAVIARQLGTPPPRVSAFRAGVPFGIEESLLRALASDLHERHPSMAAFAATLTRVHEAAGASELTAGATTATRTPFVGRAKERAELVARLDQLAHGIGGLVLIGGEPGVGKTRLAEWTLHEARSRRALALTGHCIELEGASAPFQPFVEQLETVLRIVPADRLRPTLGDAGPELTRMFPGLKRTFPDLPPPLELPPEQQRQLLFRSYREFIERAAWTQPIVALFDDLHWGDESTLLLLEHLAQQLHQLPLLALGTYRDVELDVNRPFAKTLERLTRQRWATRLPLKALPEPEVAALIGGLAGQAAPESLVATINRETDGNPFFCEEVFHHLAETGRLFDEDGRWRSDLDLAGLEVPEGVRLVVGQRLERLSETCRAVLTSAAVIGPRFEVSLLEALGDITGDALLDALDEAERAKLLRAQAAGRAPVYGFAHELIRATLLGALSLPRRQRKHLKVAEALERISAGRIEVRAAELAYHSYHAGAAAELNRTIRYQLVAARQALVAGAFEEGLRLSEQALSLEDAHGTAREAEIPQLKGLALRSLGRWRATIETWESTLTLFERLGDATAVGTLALELAWLVSYQADYARALAIAKRGLAVVGSGRSRERAMLLALGGALRAFVDDDDYEGGVEQIRRGEEAALTLADRRALDVARYNFCCVRWFYADFDSERRESTDGLARVETGADPYLVADLWSVQHNILICAGDFVAADRLRPSLIQQATRVGHFGAALNLAWTSAVRDWAQAGDLDALASAARQFSQQFAGITWGVAGDLFSSFVEFCRGNWEIAADMIEAVAVAYPTGGMKGMATGPAIVIETYAGRDTTAWGASLSRDLPGRHPAWLGRWIDLMALAEVHALCGHRAEAGSLYPGIAEALKLGLAVPVMLPSLGQCYGGIAAACAERWDEAERHFETALRQAHTLPFVLAQPETRRWYAWMLVDRDRPGDRDQARRLAEEAIAGYRRIGMPKHVELVGELLARAT